MNNVEMNSEMIRMGGGDLASGAPNLYHTVYLFEVSVTCLYSL